MIEYFADDPNHSLDPEIKQTVLFLHSYAALEMLGLDRGLCSLSALV